MDSYLKGKLSFVQQKLQSAAKYIPKDIAKHVQRKPREEEEEPISEAEPKPEEKGKVARL